MGENQEAKRPLSYSEVNKELEALEGKNDSVSNEHRVELFDELITNDMSMGDIRGAMGRATSRSPPLADAVPQPADESKPETPADS